jgi:hypothetical protein
LAGGVEQETPVQGSPLHAPARHPNVQYSSWLVYVQLPDAQVPGESKTVSRSAFAQ